MHEITPALTTQAERSTGRISPIAGNASQAGHEAVTVMNRQPRAILEAYPKDDVRRIFEHLHNENPPHRYVFGFRGKGSVPIYKHADKNKRLPVSKSIDWSLRTMEGIDDPAARHAYVPLPNNPSGKSRWGGFDFDAHNAGELGSASDLALKSFLQVVNEPFFTVLETSGAGFKLWMIANEFRDVSWWTNFLESVCRSVGVSPQPGVVELFPNREARNYGRGLRAFGTWNPRNDALNGILFDDLAGLLSVLPKEPRERSYLSSRESGPLSLSRATDGLEDFLIKCPATRHNQLLALVGKIHVWFCYAVAREKAEWQFMRKTISTNADLAAHLAEFDEMWNAKVTTWRDSLTPTEALKYEVLSTEAERAAFRIIRDFNRSAVHRGELTFPISRDSLAARIQMTGQGASQLRIRFCRAGIIKQIAPFKAHVRCATYQWTAAQ